MRAKTQNQQILKHLQSGKTISQLQALHWFGCMRLAARIYDLQESGHDIKSRMVKYNGKRYALYSLGGKK